MDVNMMSDSLLTCHIQKDYLLWDWLNTGMDIYLNKDAIASFPDSCMDGDISLKKYLIT